MDCFSDLTYIGENLTLDMNPVLANPDGFSKLNHVGGCIVISRNSILKDLCSLRSLFLNGTLGGSYQIQSNLYNPGINQIVTGNCSM